VTIEWLDDGALRSVLKNGDVVDSRNPGCLQPHGDPSQMPEGKTDWRYRGDKMDLGLAIEVMFQQERRAKDVPAGT
jgi:hypothetical protein